MPDRNPTVGNSPISMHIHLTRQIFAKNFEERIRTDAELNGISDIKSQVLTKIRVKITGR